MTIKASTRPGNAVQVDGKVMQFSGKNNMFMTKYKGLATEIEARYGRKGEVMPCESVTVPVEYAGREPGHKYTFSMPEMPWKKQSK